MSKYLTDEEFLGGNLVSDAEFLGYGGEEPTEEQGDFSRGLKTVWPQTKALAGGATALVGDTFGIESLRDYGLDVYQRNMEDAGQYSKPTDDIITSWDKATKEGDWGSLIDTAQYWSGYASGQALESLAAGVAGAALGGVINPATGVAGAASKGTIKTLVQKAIEKMAQKRIAKGVAKAEAEKQAAKALSRRIGAGAALFAQNSMMELGSIYGEADEYSGGNLDNADLARIWGAGIAAASIESVADVLGAKGALTAGTGGTAKEILSNAVRETLTGATREAATETVQTGIERFGAGKPLTGEEAKREYATSAFAGAIGGGQMGVVSGVAQGINRAPADQQGEVVSDEEFLGEDSPPVSDPQADTSVQPLNELLGEETPTPQPETPIAEPQPPMAALPAPVIEVTPEGEAATIAQREQAKAEQEAIGLTPDVIQAQKKMAESQKIDVKPAEPPIDQTQEVEAVDDKSRQKRERLNTLRRIYPEKDDILTAIAKSGGISRELAKAEGFDPAGFNLRRGMGQPVFSKQGRSLDDLRESLSQYGYVSGEGDTKEFVEKINKALAGEFVGTPQGLEAKARQSEIERQLEQGDEKSLAGEVADIEGEESASDKMVAKALGEAIGLGVNTPSMIDRLNALGDDATHSQLYQEIQTIIKEHEESEPTIEKRVDDSATREIETEDEIDAAIGRFLSGEEKGLSQEDAERALGIEKESEKKPITNLIGKDEIKNLTGKERSDLLSAADKVVGLTEDKGVNQSASEILKSLGDDEQNVFLRFAAGFAQRKGINTLNGKVLRRAAKWARVDSAFSDMNEKSKTLGSADMSVDLPSLELKSYTEKDLAEQEQDKKAKTEKAKKTQAEEQKRAKADEDAKDFVLTGSDRPADEAMARGQKSIFDQQPKQEPKKPVEKPKPKSIFDEVKPSVDEAAHEAATSPKNDLPAPTEAQIEAGNYKKGKIRIHGLEISIENPKGSVRSGVDESGKAWEQTMQNHYGYIRKTEAADGDHLDVFVGPNEKSRKVYVVDQVDKNNRFDEVKVMIGFESLQDAKEGYLENYGKGWPGLGKITEASIDEFKQWSKSKETKLPFSSRKTRDEIPTGISSLDSNEGQMPEPKQPAIQILRGERGAGVRSLEKQLPDVSQGYWEKTSKGLYLRESEQQRKLRTEERDLGHSKRPSQESKQQSLDRVQREKDAANRLGEGNRNTATLPEKQVDDIWMEHGKGADYKGGGAQKEQQDTDIQGKDSADVGVGERNRYESPNIEKQNINLEVERRKSTDRTAAEAQKEAIIPEPAYMADQPSLKGVTYTEQVVVLETGKKAKVTRKADVEWNKLQKRRESMLKVIECLR